MENQNEIKPLIVEEKTPMTPAERMYKNHLKNVKKYQQKNPEKMKEKSKKYNEKIKEEKPDEYKEMLMKKREYYLNIRKPRIQELRQLKQVEEQLKKNEENHKLNP
jgi:hypothetical protein